MNSTFGKVTQLGYQQLTGIAAATAPVVPPGARIALINCEGQACRWRDDKTDPTATVGMIINVTDDTFEYTGHLGSLRFIETAIGGIVNISFYG